MSPSATLPSLDSAFVASASEYQILEKPSRSGRKLRIICLGGGASALNLAHEVSISSLDLDLVCYEKNPSIGGTCSRGTIDGMVAYYSSASEILQYFKDVAEKYDLNKYVRLNHTVVVQRNNPDDVITDKADIFINASGVLK
ncbi:unnamed protein product, partial [Clonostachys rosea f. rosea IK726]